MDIEDKLNELCLQPFYSEEDLYPLLNQPDHATPCCSKDLESTHKRSNNDDSDGDEENSNGKSSKPKRKRSEEKKGNNKDRESSHKNKRTKETSGTSADKKSNDTNKKDLKPKSSKAKRKRSEEPTGSSKERGKGHDKNDNDEDNEESNNKSPKAKRKRSEKENEDHKNKGKENNNSDSDDNEDDEATSLERKKARIRQRLSRERQNKAKKALERIKAKERMANHRKKQSLAEVSTRRELDKCRKRLIRTCKTLSLTSSDLDVGIDVHQYGFDVYQKSLTWYSCSICKKRQIFSIQDKKPCSNCNLYTSTHDLDPLSVPSELKDLTYIEQQLISRIHPVVSLYKVKNVQYKYTGQVINFPQNVQQIASALPRKLADLTGTLTIRLKNSDGHCDFFINRARVLNALIWLKKNNPFYEDIIISMENVDDLPEHSSVYSLLRGYDLDDEEGDLSKCHTLSDDVTFLCTDDDSTDIDPIIYKDVPDLSYVSQKDQLDVSDTVLLWPSIGKTPINEFSSPGYITMSFPHLFPYGTCDYSNRRNNKISLDKYVQHLMLYKDGRFAKDPRFRFFMLNSIMRWQALKLGNIFVRQNSFFNNMTVCQLKQYLKKNPGHVRDILFYSRRIRSTKAYWRSRCSELEDMVKQIGAPTIFFTLSSADYHWPELYRLLGHNDSQSLSYEEKSKLLSENPLVVTTFFKLRVQYFLKKSLSEHFDVEDYWYRTEFQSRGSSHVHGVLWLKNAPDILNLKTAEQKADAMDFFSKIVSCNNPDISFRPNLTHPCSKLISDIDDHDDDLSELVNRVQRHTCSTQYCLKRRNKICKNCRFGFPKDLLGESNISETENGLEINFMRNDQFVNNYNSWVLQTWRSNIDFSPIISERILYKYIAKYASKCEYNSQDYTSILENILSNSTFEDEHCKKVIRKLMIKTCCEHDYSAQEVIYLVMGFPLFNASRDFVVINLNNKNWKMLELNSTEKRSKSFMERYMTRPSHYSTYSLTEFAKAFYYHKNRLVKRTRLAIVRLFPRFTRLITDYNDLVNACIFHVPWTDLDSFDCHEEELKALLEIRNISIDNLEDNILEFSDDIYDDPDESNDLKQRQNEGESKDIKKMSLISRLKPTETDDIPKKSQGKFDYQYGCRKYDYGEVQSYVKKIKNLQNNETNTFEVDSSKLSLDQTKAYNYFKSIVNATLKKKKSTSNRVIIQGKAGSGKSYLLHCMKKYLTETLGSTSYVALGPTGVSSRNIGGTTLHSFFKFPRKVQKFRRLQVEDLSILHEKHKDLKFVFIDEYSMLGYKTLSMVEQRCREYKDSNEIFGGLNIILLGDIYQLGPVGDKALYDLSNIEKCSALAHLGKAAIDSFQKAFVLKSLQRFDSVSYSNFLDRLSVGKCTLSDWKKINKRHILRSQTEQEHNFHNAIKICSVNDDVKQNNNKRLRQLRKPIVQINADNNCDTAFKSPDMNANGLSNVIYLSLQSRVMLRHNLNVNYGLVNGSLGTVIDILYEPNVIPPSLPKYIIVKFDGIKGFEYLNDGIPIVPIHTNWSVNRTSCTRVQFPICLSWSCTIHKSQGLTIEKCYIDLGTNDFQIGLTYVALSRVKNIKSFLLMNAVTLERMNSVKNSMMFQFREDFVSWLNSIA